MKRVAAMMSFCVLCAACLFAASDGVEKTMTVKRCIATDGKGGQCVHQAEKGKDYCWRHCKAVRAMNSTLDDAGKGASEAWQSTKQWSTNTWQKTKSGAKSAWDSTKDAANEARVGLVELLGGKDGK